MIKETERIYNIFLDSTGNINDRYKKSNMSANEYNFLIGEVERHFNIVKSCSDEIRKGAADAKYRNLFSTQVNVIFDLHEIFNRKAVQINGQSPEKYRNEVVRFMDEKAKVYMQLHNAQIGAKNQSSTCTIS